MLILKGPKRGTRARTCDNYDSDFLLKIDSIGTATDTVCSLWVKTDDGLKAWKVVRVEDFSVAGVYDTIALTYYISDEKNLQYGIKWYGNRNLWIDYIETKDSNIDDVVNNHLYDDTLNSIFSRYDTLAALKYYYLMDEPDVGHFAANAYLIYCDPEGLDPADL